LIRRTAIN